MSNLNTFLKERGLTYRAFAVMIEVDPSIVSRLAAGKMLPSLPLAARIEKATDGEIPMGAWVAANRSSVRRAS